MNSFHGDPADSRMVERLMIKLEEKSMEIETLTEQVKECEERLNNMVQYLRNVMSACQYGLKMITIFRCFGQRRM